MQVTVTVATAAAWPAGPGAVGNTPSHAGHGLSVRPAVWLPFTMAQTGTSTQHASVTSVTPVAILGPTLCRMR